MGAMGYYNASVQFQGKLKRWLSSGFAQQLGTDAYVRGGAQDRITQAVIAQAPYKTGQLAGSIYSVTYHQNGGTQIAIKSKLDYAQYVIKGTKAHPIDAVNVPDLYFWWEKMGVQFSGPHVDHPGTQPNDFVARAWVAIRSKELQEFKRIVIATLIA